MHVVEKIEDYIFQKNIAGILSFIILISLIIRILSIKYYDFIWFEGITNFHLMQASEILSTGLRSHSAYIVPGYSYFIGFLMFFFSDNILGIKIFQILIDGIGGPVLLASIFYFSGHRIAAIVSSFLYAIFIPFANLATAVLPDNFNQIMTLAIITPIIIGYYKNRFLIGVMISALLIGIGGYLRGEYLALVPFFLFSILIFSNRPINLRVKTAIILLLVILITSIPVVLYYSQTFGVFTFTRAGIGTSLWTGIGEYPNPWGCVCDDRVVAQFLSSHGYQYGTFEADSFLLKESIAHIIEDPILFIQAVFLRSKDILAFAYYIDSNNSQLKFSIPGVILSIGTLFLIVLALIGFWRYRNEQWLLAICASVWCSRFLPFIFRQNEPRFILPLYIIYFIGTALFVEYYYKRLFSRGPNKNVQNNSM